MCICCVLKAGFIGDAWVTGKTMPQKKTQQKTKNNETKQIAEDDAPKLSQNAVTKTPRTYI